MSSRKEKVSSPDYPVLARQLVSSVCEASDTGAICKLPAGLYVVATPIGHLGDMTMRGLSTLAQADAIGCEDTRTSGVLLKAYGLHRPTFALHDHNEQKQSIEIVRRIQKGDAIALISDAGMPAIADPGFKLIRACHDAKLPVTVIPGANAAISAMAGSGLPTDQFHFVGFLSTRTTARRNEIAELKAMKATLIFYESPQRLSASLADLAEVLGTTRTACVARELTKLHEEFRRGTLSELATYYADAVVKGEIVILVARDEMPDTLIDIDKLLVERLKSLSVRDAVAEIATITGGKKNDIYARALALDPKQKPPKT